MNLAISAGKVHQRSRSPEHPHIYLKKAHQWAFAPRLHQWAPCSPSEIEGKYVDLPGPTVGVVNGHPEKPVRSYQ